MVGCPHCGSADSQVMDLLAAWKEIEVLKALLKKRPERVITVREETVPVMLSPGGSVPFSKDIDVCQAAISVEPIWEDRYNKIKEAYIKTRLEVSGSFGNWSGDTRRRVLEHEISAELGFTV